jgi:hypothetical protein
MLVLLCARRVMPSVRLLCLIMSLTKTALTISMFAVFLISGCGTNTKPVRDPDLVLEGYNPPKFRISGQGMLDIIEVSGPDPNRKAAEGAIPYSKDYWVIMPKGDYKLSRLEELGPVIYGHKPEGFEQWVPRSGEVPALVEGETYHIHLRTKNGPAVSRFFVLRDGKIIATGDGS